MNRTKQHCDACGRISNVHTHNCPVAIDRPDWSDVAGSQSRFVAFPCPCCGMTTHTTPVGTTKQPASMYGVGQFECECGEAGEVRFCGWPMRPQRPAARQKSRRGFTYGT